MQSNEFKGADLKDAVRKATAAYRQPEIELTDVCSDLAIRLSDFKREAGRAADRAETLRREADRLASSARQAARDALLNAALAAAGYFGAAARALRRLQSIRHLSELRWGDYLRLIPFVGSAFAASANALKAVKDSLEAETLSRKADDEEREAEQLGEEIVRIADEYTRSGCGENRNLS